MSSHGGAGEVNAVQPVIAAPRERPISATPPLSAGLGLVAVLVSLWGLRHWNAEPHVRALALIGIVGGVVLVTDRVLGVHRRGTTGLAAEARPGVAVGRIVRKLVGLGATLGVVAGLYALFPEYAGKFYAPVWAAVRLLAPWFIVVAPVYVWAVDRRQDDPEDAYAALGAWILHRRPLTDRAALAVLARSWLVKGFFLPLMFVYATRDLASLTTHLNAPLPDRFLPAYDLLYSTGYLLDILFTCAGYALTLRLADTHTRSVESTSLGWVACILCYQPFWSVVGEHYLAYDDDGIVWGPRFASLPWLQVAWGCAILACVAVYAWATISFGVRFSNLSHRGIITSGPYRWLKHPAYVSKNVSWWLVAVPFFYDGSPTTAVRGCLLLLGLNGVYALRAWTEERHLAQDPTYRAYQAWMAEHGVYARVRRSLLRGA